ncbi:polysaccharide biosynthesis/export family protein [Xanthobacter sp.]|uniref:polysaccharide biosynthesis/export family protein n=1 Tax=Xanthobacter sp. TaxID=35809 RepID=UPI0025D48465|nr:polysaccharide biosynthesis/export family protein [Xanthobacter sp.]
MVLPECSADTAGAPAPGSAPALRGPRVGRRRAGAIRAGVSLCVIALLLNGCAAIATSQQTGTEPFTTGHELRFTEVNADRFKPWSDVVPSYRLGPGDKLKVKYFITREMDEDLVVSPDGSIAPRAIGQIRVEGSTLSSVQDYIRRESRKELVDQKVVVSLEEAISAKVYVGGMVPRPGAYKLADMGTSALQGILLAGGFTEEARTGQVALIRRGPNNEPMLRIINVRDVIQTGFDANDVPLVTGDIIYVPRSSIAEVNLWIDQFITKVVPFQRQFSYTLGSYTTNTGSTLIQ